MNIYYYISCGRKIKERQSIKQKRVPDNADVMPFFYSMKTSLLQNWFDSRKIILSTFDLWLLTIMFQ